MAYIGLIVSETSVDMTIYIKIISCCY